MDGFSYIPQFIVIAPITALPALEYQKMDIPCLMGVSQPAACLI